MLERKGFLIDAEGHRLRSLLRKEKPGSRFQITLCVGGDGLAMAWKNSRYQRFWEKRLAAELSQGKLLRRLVLKSHCNPAKLRLPFSVCHPGQSYTGKARHEKTWIRLAKRLANDQSHDEIQNPHKKEQPNKSLARFVLRGEIHLACHDDQIEAPWRKFPQKLVYFLKIFCAWASISRAWSSVGLSTQ